MINDKIKWLEEHLESNNGFAKREAIMALNIIKQQQEENKRLQAEMIEKARNVFTNTVSKFMSLDDLYVVVEGDYLPWEPSEEIEWLFKISLAGEDEDLNKDIDRVIKEMEKR